MECEVVVVGGGIGGLTVAALLAQRGMSVCLLERQSEVGGCAASFDKFGFQFEKGYGLYSSWQPGEIHDRIFTELPTEPPEVRRLDPAYVVRLPDHSEVRVGKHGEEFEQNLREVFPECAEAAIGFYRELDLVAMSPRKLLNDRGALAGNLVSAHLGGLSFRFCRFIDAQLQTLVQRNNNEVPYLYAALALSEARRGMFAIRGGSAELARRLADSIRTSGGRIRLDSPVLRLAYDPGGNAIGVDLLSGEKVTATKSIVSNLTLWDTYGKLVGLNRTPPEIRKRLQSLRGWGAYLLFLSLDDDGTRMLASDRLLTSADWQSEAPYTPEKQQLFFNAAPPWDKRAPAGKRAVTVHAFTNVDDWFSFHTDEEELEARDQSMLAACWERLHQAMPELGSTVEVIDSMNPRGYYDSTRRKLGMVGNVLPEAEQFRQRYPSYVTSLPNLLLISDTTAGASVAAISRAALELADKLAPPAK
ncbi:MAG: phytoene desaturase family protein [Pyrinomonadaceae bacterium]